MILCFILFQQVSSYDPGEDQQKASHAEKLELQMNDE
tara:strand:+ start:972 stop:1082 length:111 start_codon:yes stop_codon:yes gene_type:complete